MMMVEEEYPRFDEQFYPGTHRRGRWVFLQQVFSSLAFQVVLTIALALIVVFVRPVANFFAFIPGCLVIYICSIVLPITVVSNQHFFDRAHHQHFFDLFHRPINLFSIGLFTAAVTFAFGLACSYTNGFHFLHVKYDFAWEMMFEFVIGLSVTVLSLPMYKLWGKMKDRVFKCIEGQLSLAAVFTVVFALIQILFPLGRILIIICGVLCGYIIVIRIQSFGLVVPRERVRAL